MCNLVKASELLAAFRSGSLKNAVSKIEAKLVGISKGGKRPVGDLLYVSHTIG